MREVSCAWDSVCIISGTPRGERCYRPLAQGVVEHDLLRRDTAKRAMEGQESHESMSQLLIPHHLIQSQRIILGCDGASPMTCLGSSIPGGEKVGGTSRGTNPNPSMRSDTRDGESQKRPSTTPASAGSASEIPSLRVIPSRASSLPSSNAPFHAAVNRSSSHPDHASRPVSFQGLISPNAMHACKVYPRKKGKSSVRVGCLVSPCRKRGVRPKFRGRCRAMISSASRRIRSRPRRSEETSPLDGSAVCLSYPSCPSGGGSRSKTGSRPGRHRSGEAAKSSNGEG